jgi:hypothetical protein
MQALSALWFQACPAKHAITNGKNRDALKRQVMFSSAPPEPFLAITDVSIPMII